MIHKQFYSANYEGDEGVEGGFVCLVEGQEEGDSEELLLDELEGIGGTVVCTDSYEFENQDIYDVHVKLVALDYEYLGSFCPDAIDTSSR